MKSRQTENKNSPHFRLRVGRLRAIGVKHNRTNWPGSWSRSSTLWGRLRVRLRLQARTRTQGDSDYVHLTVSVCGAFINMPLFELHACVWNYHIGLIRNTNVAANKPPICKNKGCYYWQNNNKHTLFSQKNNDKSNEVTWGFLNIISGWCSIRFTPAFSTPAFSTPAFSTLAILPVSHFLIPHFQSSQYQQHFVCCLNWLFMKRR